MVASDGQAGTAARRPKKAPRPRVLVAPEMVTEAAWALKVEVGEALTERDGIYSFECAVRAVLSALGLEVASADKTR